LNTNITLKWQHKILYHRLFDILLVQEIILSYRKSLHSLWSCTPSFSWTKMRITNTLVVSTNRNQWTLTPNFVFTLRVSITLINCCNEIKESIKMLLIEGDIRLY
jgi:hypothetical protein